MARELACFLIENPGSAKNPLELLGAYEDSLGNEASMKRAFEDYPTQDYQNVMEAIGNLLVEQKSACVVLTKNSTLVIAPAGPSSDEYIILDVNSKHVSYTHAPEYVPMVNVATACLVTAAIPEVKLEEPPLELPKKPKKVTIVTPAEKKKRTRKLVVPTVELHVEQVVAEPPPAKVSRLEDDSSESKNKTATL